VRVGATSFSEGTTASVGGINRPPPGARLSG
jgi:hypothetical protein